MYSLSPEVAQALAEKPHVLRLSDAGSSNQIIAQGAELLSVVHTSSVCGHEQLCCGNVCSASVTVTTAIPLSLIGQRIAVEVGAEVDNLTHWLPLGVFEVTACKQDTDSHTTTLSAYDALYTNTGGTYLPTVTSGASVADVIANLCQQCGIAVGALPSSASTTIVNGSLTGYPCRELLGYLAMLVGCNAVLDRHNQLRLVWFTAGGTLTADEYYAGQLTQDGTFTLSGLSVTVHASSDGQSDGILSVGSSQSTPSLTNPLMSQALLNRVWERIGGLTYQVGAVSCCGGFCTEAGDLVQVCTANGNTLTLPAMSVALTLDGGCQCTISATGVSSGDSDTYTGGLNGTVRTLKADLAEFKQVTAEKLNVTEELLVGVITSAESAQAQAEQATAVADEAKQAVMNLPDRTNIYYQSSFPNAPHTGDVLFRSDNGGIYRYNGTGWLAHQVGTVSIKDGSITADKCVMSSLVADNAFVNAVNTNSIVIGAVNTANSALSSANSAKSTASSALSTASNSSKTATNYLKFDAQGTGLIIGDMTTSSLGGNTQILSDCVNIRAGEQILSSFSGTGIDVSTSSDFCGVTFMDGVAGMRCYAGMMPYFYEASLFCGGRMTFEASDYSVSNASSFRSAISAASESHTHSGYASSSHTHSGYASSSHTHSGYASSSHTHSGYQQTLATSTESISLGSISAGSTSSGSVNVSWSGHTVLGVVGWTTGTGTGNSLFSVPRLYTNGSTLYYLVRNIGSATYSCTLNVTILYG